MMNFYGLFHNFFRTRSVSALLCLVTAFLLCPLFVGAQEITATLSGVVTDTTGAVIPHASITISLNGTSGAARTIQSDGSGNYVATNLTAGTYSVSITAAGFETFKGKNIVLNVAEKHSFNAQLKAGAVTTTVTVEDNPVQVDTETSGQAGTISGVQIRELEINSRNFEQLVTLQPGVVSQLGDEASAGATALSVNGARTTANNWTVDGADINDSGSNGTVVNEPSIEAIDEITLQRGNYDAGYGRSGGGQVLVATKSGSSAFHGSGYEYVRNTMFDANDYLNKKSQLANGEKNEAGVNHHNVYGFTIGGPIYIPKFYNESKTKTFFFWSEDWHKITTATTSSILNSPTTSAMAGNFTTPSQLDNTTHILGPVIAPPTLPGTCTLVSYTVDPTTHASAGQIDMNNPDCLSHNANAVYSKYVFTPNTNDAGQITENAPSKNDYRDDIIRIDHYFNDKIHFYARGMNDVMPVSDPFGLWANGNYPGLANTSVDSPGKNVVGNITWTISPKVVNEFEFVYSQGTYHSSFSGTVFANNATYISSLSPNTQKYSDKYGRMPAVSIEGIQGFSPGSTPWKERNLDRTYFDNLSMTYGKHTLRLGFQLQQMLKTENAVNGGSSFNFQAPFSTDATSYSIVSFLLGDVYSYGQSSNDTIPDLNYYNTEIYINDDWKVNQRLTFNLGLRWSSFPSPKDKKNTLSNFDQNLYSPQAAPVIDPTTGNFEPNQVIGGYTLVADTYANGLIFPKGQACTQAQAISPQVQCSPYGAYVNPNSNANFAPRVGFAFNPDGHGVTSIRGGIGIFYDRVLNGMWEQNAFTNPGVTKSVTVYNGSFDDYTSGTTGLNYGPNHIETTGYPTFKVPDYADYNLTVERQLLPTTVLSVAYVGSEARHLAGEIDANQPTLAAIQAHPTTKINALRPYLGYGYIKNRTTIFTSNYNSLQLDIQHRSSKGLTVGAAYTWSKTLTTNSADRDSAATYTQNLKMDYGPSTFNQPQTLVFNYVYSLPFFKEQHGAEGLLLGGWELSGITQLLSGTSFSVVQSGDPYAGSCATCSVEGLGINSIDGSNAARPDQVAKVHMTKKVDQWFSYHSFSAAQGHWGSTSAGSLLGPGMDKWDLALAKNTKLGEHVTFQLRAEAFNLFNHTNFSGVGSNISSGLPDDPDVNKRGNFGTVTGDHEPRLLQLGGKISF